MAKKFLTSIDLNGNQLIKPILENVSPNPTSDLAKGRLAFNTTSNVPIVYDGASWKNLQYEIPTGTYLTQNQTITLSGIITGSGRTAITTAIADGKLSIAKTSGLQTALDAKMSTTSYPSLTAIQTIGATATPIGFLKKTGANTWSIDTNTYLKSNANAVSATKLATARDFSITGGATAAAISFNGTDNVALDVTALDASKLGGTIPSAVLGKSSIKIGSTVIKLNGSTSSLAGLSSVAIGSAVLKYDATNNALYVEKTDGTKVNFYATGELGAHGVGGGFPSPGTGTGVNTFKDLNDVDLANPLTNQILVYNGTHWVNTSQSALAPDLDGYVTAGILEQRLTEEVSKLLNNPSEALDSLMELAEALGNDPNFATTIATELGKKEPTIKAGTTTQYWKGNKTWATLNTTAVPEGDNLYYTNARVKSYGDTLYLGKTATASKATALATARTFSIGGSTGLTATGIKFSGTGNVALSLSGSLKVANGGTGLTDAKDGFTRKVTGTLTTSSTSYEITHGLGTDVVVQVIEVASKEVVECDIIMTSTTKATIKFNKPPAANAYRYIIVG